MPPKKGRGKASKKQAEEVEAAAVEAVEEEQQPLATTAEQSPPTSTAAPEKEIVIEEKKQQEVAAETEPVAAAEKVKATSLNDRLFALRMKINQSRKQNRDDIDEEFQRISGKRPKNADGVEEEPERRKKSKASADESSLLQTTAEEAQWAADKKRCKDEVAATYGLSAFSTDASFRAYEKRVQKLSASGAGVTSSNQQALALAENPLDYGKVNSAVSQENLERLRNDVLEREAARKKFSRSRVGDSTGDVDYINDKNKQFNKRLRSSFDKYTVEIRQNLERGTAL